jgi:hypothetical protein
MIIKEITIPSIEEYNEYRDMITAVNDRWWLRSPGLCEWDAAYVSADGFVDEYGIYVHDLNTAVRPALRLNLEFGDPLYWYKAKTLVGSKISFGGYTWLVLDTDGDELYVLCNKVVRMHRFDSSTNVWKKSELKCGLENWFLEQIIKQEAPAIKV